jgi:hypothetical protein
MPRTLKWGIGAAVVQAVEILVLSWLLPDFDVGDPGTALLLGVLVLLGIAALWPLTHGLAARLHPLVFPLLVVVLSGGVILLSVALTNLMRPDAVRVDSSLDGMLVAFGLVSGATVVSVLFSLDDQRIYDFVVTRQLRRLSGGTTPTDVPGVLFLQLDGLARPILQQAIAAGYMPTVQRWLESGSHRVVGWEPDLSSQTSASQAGILLGNNEGIPAFRWWDKRSGQLMVSSEMATARALERQLSSGKGLLSGGGASRWNVFSGDATDCLGTYSQMGRGTTSGRTSYFLYLSNPYSLARAAMLFVVDVVRERVEALRQRLTGVQPRVQRGLKFAFVRAGTTVLLQEAGQFMLTADMYRGVPAVYATFFGYDQVAHYAGIDRSDALKVLRSLDRVVAHLERVARDAPRPYHIVLLSDHGHSQGANFRQRYGQTLADLVRELTDAPRGVTSITSGDEGLAGINSALSEAIRSDSRTLRLVLRAMRGGTADGDILVGQQQEEADERVEAAARGSDAVVVASGNLGLISFPHFPERLTYEQIAAEFPGLLRGLAEHEGVSFVVVRSESAGSIAIGAQGIHYLGDGHVAGTDPLGSFGPNAARHLIRADGFENAPDIFVVGLYDPDTGEVAAFEEQVGSHGGLGGSQTQPFVLFPVELEIDLDEPIVGTAALHRTLKAWTPSVPQPDEAALPA